MNIGSRRKLRSEGSELFLRTTAGRSRLFHRGGADRLKNSSDGLAAIAQSLGYESESAFSKAFRRVMGCSPRQYTRSPAPRATT